MYNPSIFRVENNAELVKFMRAYGFATLVSRDRGELEATSIPLLTECDTSGIPNRLIGHMAQANGQWERADGTSVLVLFQGPHAYISPTWYGETNTVPTWNYVTVHVSGTLRVINDPQFVLETLRRTVEFYEEEAQEQWSMDIPETGFIEQLVAGIVAFEIEIASVEGKWKLSQNHSRERRQRVINALRKSSTADGLEIAALMEEALPPEEADFNG